jgi:hypothetical protein
MKELIWIKPLGAHKRMNRSNDLYASLQELHATVDGKKLFVHGDGLRYQDKDITIGFKPVIAMLHNEIAELPKPFTGSIMFQASRGILEGAVFTLT